MTTQSSDRRSTHQNSDPTARINQAIEDLQKLRKVAEECESIRDRIQNVDQLRVLQSIYDECERISQKIADDPFEENVNTR